MYKFQLAEKKATFDNSSCGETVPISIHVSNKIFRTLILKKINKKWEHFIETKLLFAFNQGQLFKKRVTTVLFGTSATKKKLLHKLPKWQSFSQFVNQSTNRFFVFITLYLNRKPKNILWKTRKPNKFF